MEKSNKHQTQETQETPDTTTASPRRFFHIFPPPCFASVNKLSIIVNHLASQPIRGLGKLLPGGTGCGGSPDRANYLWEITS